MQPTHQSQEGFLPVVLPASGAEREASSPAVDPPDAIPAVLDPAAFEHHYRECLEVFQPVGHLEVMVVRDIARHLTAAETWDAGVRALMRQRAQRVPHLAELQALLGDEEDAREEVALAAAVSAAEVRLGERNAQTRSRALYRALDVLQDLQAQRRVRETEGDAQDPPRRFRSEEACRQYLEQRFLQGHYACPHCDGRRWHHLAGRQSCECAGCGRQVGLRVGTVAADSPLPLMAWFTAIRLILVEPTIRTVELQVALGISRAATVRSMARRVNAALAADDASARLAGLDRYYAGLAETPPESSAPDGAAVAARRPAADSAPPSPPTPTEAGSYGSGAVGAISDAPT